MEGQSISDRLFFLVMVNKSFSDFVLGFVDAERSGETVIG